MLDNFIEKLSERYLQGLPGREFQAKMAVLARRNTMEAPPTARKAGVMILLFPKNGHWHVLLTERTSTNPNDRHGGQISFPGGQLDPVDDSMMACALRETFEEVGIPEHEIQVVGPMTDLYIPVSNFHVFPFVGWVSTPPQYQKQDAEVKQILETPLHILQNPENWRITDLKITEELTLKDVPYFDVYGKIVWGATAMMLSEFLELIKD